MDNQDEQYRIDDLFGGQGDCQHALHTLYDYLDGELTPERRQAIRRHLDQCGPCLHAFDWEAELKIVVARSCRDQVPEALRLRISQVLYEASDAERGTV